jgi:hypothetical protein
MALVWLNSSRSSPGKPARPSRPPLRGAAGIAGNDPAEGNTGSPGACTANFLKKTEAVCVKPLDIYHRHKVRVFAAYRKKCAQMWFLKNLFHLLILCKQKHDIINELIQSHSLRSLNQYAMRGFGSE